MQFGKKAMVSGALLAATFAGGAVGATLIGSAGAQTGSSSTEAATAAPAAPDPSQGGHTANGVTETLLTGDTASKVTAAAQEAVPGATIDRVETDAEGAAYEAHVTKADGTKATVKVNEDFSVAGVETGMR
jgi:hypothetical protein